MDVFTPISLGPYSLRSRIVMAPMTRNRAGKGSVPTPLNAQYYGQRSGAGLIVTEATQISRQGVGYPATPGIHSKEQIEGWKRVTEAVHACGGRIFLQLWHVGRISHPSLQPDGMLPVAPSAIRPDGNAMTYEGPQPFVTPRALDLSEIAGIVNAYRNAAGNALEGGFDGVEIHSANGYLPDQFLRDKSNRRTDRYGGSKENRARFLLEVAEAVADIWGADRVGVRLSPSNTFNDMADSDPAGLFDYAVRALDDLKLSYLHLVETGLGGGDVGSVRLDAAHFRALCRMPIIVNGGYDKARADQVLQEGAADLVSFGVPFLANPDLPTRFLSGSSLNKPDRATFYGGGEKGYADYPSLSEVAAAAVSP